MMFDSILGHERIKKQLESHIKRRAFHQAYLFSGPGHIGKMKLALTFMRHINPAILDPIVPGRSKGMLAFLDDGGSLKVEAIRTIANFAKLRISDDDVAFCFMEHSERMTTAAANAFLKILEEPIPRLIFFMTTRQEKKLLSTIRSRLQIFRMTIPPWKVVDQYFQKSISNPVTIQELMTFSGGRIGLALSLSLDPTYLERMRKLYDDAAIVMNQDLTDRFSLAELMSQKDFSEDDLLQFLLFLAERLRRDGIGRNFSMLQCLQNIARLFRETNINKRLWLEELFLHL